MTYLHFCSRAVIEILDFTYAAFRTFLRYLYTDKIEPSLPTAEDLIGKHTQALSFQFFHTLA